MDKMTRESDEFLKGIAVEVAPKIFKKMKKIVNPNEESESGISYALPGSMFMEIFLGDLRMELLKKLSLHNNSGDCKPMKEARDGSI